MMQLPEHRPVAPADRSSYAIPFVSALLDPEKPAPGVVAGPNNKAAEKRYNVYRNNVTVSLINAIAAVFPATQRVTGVDFFRMMARLYVRAMPPTSPLLFEYGRGFPDFIARYEHAGSMPWLADVAQIERAWLDAYHAADAEPLRPDALALIPEERLAETTFVPHPAARVARSRYSAVTIFSANRVDGPVGRIDASKPEDALVTRPALDVAVRRLPPGGAVFLTTLISGAPLGDALDKALEEDPGFDLSANLVGMFEAGVFIGVGGVHDGDGFGRPA
jgi:hypothetical protein